MLLYNLKKKYRGILKVIFTFNKGSKDDIANRILNFLMEPDESLCVEPAEDEDAEEDEDDVAEEDEEEASEEEKHKSKSRSGGASGGRSTSGRPRRATVGKSMLYKNGIKIVHNYLYIFLFF